MRPESRQRPSLVISAPTTMTSHLDTLHRTPCDATRYRPDSLAEAVGALPGCMWCLNVCFLGGDCPGVADPDHAYQPEYGIGIDPGSELRGDWARDETDITNNIGRTQ